MWIEGVQIIIYSSVEDNIPLTASNSHNEAIIDIWSLLSISVDLVSGAWGRKIGHHPIWLGRGVTYQSCQTQFFTETE